MKYAGGTAGCIIAGRLAEADPDLSILVIEGGADNKDVPHIVNPAFYLQNLLPATKTALFYKGNKSEHLAGREAIVPSGGTLGGGSSINFMMYTRAQRSDFDSWKTPGWTAEELIPFANKVGLKGIQIGYPLTIHRSKTTMGLAQKTCTDFLAPSE